MKKRRNAVVFTEIHNYSIIDDITLSKLKSARSRPSLFSLFFLSTETWCRRFSSSSLKSLIDKTDGNGPLCCALEMGPLLALAQKPIRALKLSDGRIRKTSRGLRERERHLLEQIEEKMASLFVAVTMLSHSRTNTYFISAYTYKLPEQRKYWNSFIPSFTSTLRAVGGCCIVSILIWALPSLKQALLKSAHWS